MSLLQRIRNECIFTHYEPKSRTQWTDMDFGGEDEIERLYLFFGCIPGDSYTTFQSLLVPTIRPTLPLEQASVSSSLSFEHYPLTKLKVSNAYKGLSSLEPQALESLDKLFTRYARPSALRTNLRGEGVLIGEQGLLQRVMDAMKQRKENIFVLSKALLKNAPLQQISSITLIDHCKEPNEIKYWFH